MTSIFGSGGSSPSRAPPSCAPAAAKLSRYGAAFHHSFLTPWFRERPLVGYGIRENDKIAFTRLARSRLSRHADPQPINDRAWNSLLLIIVPSYFRIFRAAKNRLPAFKNNKEHLYRYLSIWGFWAMLWTVDNDSFFNLNVSELCPYFYCLDTLQIAFVTVFSVQ